MRRSKISNYGSFIAHHDNPNYKFLQGYDKLRKKIITNDGNFIVNYNSGLLQITTILLQITTKNYYKLRQLLFLENLKLLQITSNFITNYDSF